MPWTSGQIVRVAWYVQLNAFRACTTRHYRVTAVTNGGPGLNVAAARFWTVYSPLILACLNQQSELQGVTIANAATPATIIEGWTLGPGVFGNGSLEPLPPAVSGLIRLRGDRRQQPNWGRVYMPFPGEGDNALSAVPSAGYLTSLQAVANQLLLATTASDTSPIPPFPVRSVTFRACLLPSTAGRPNLLTQATAVSAWATQRRRSTPPFNVWSPFG